MLPNDVMRAVRYLLDLGDAQVADVIHLSDPDFPADKAQVHAWLKKDDEEGYVECPDRALTHFLDGLVIHYRGRREDAAPRVVEKRLTNNAVLKRLRIAFELKDTDMLQAFADAGFPIGKSELTALFRQPGHVNYRVCGDQLLRNFLKGLTLRARGPERKQPS
jgi:uncharacterized protein YehS (DUF1456 family)